MASSSVSGMIVRFRSATALAAAALLLAPACDVHPQVRELHYSLNQPVLEKNKDLAGNPGAQAQIEGALEMLFGTPRAPRFLVLPEWGAKHFDPNYWGEDLVKGDEKLRAALVASNQSHFREQLDAIRAGRFDQVDHPRFADDLWQKWQELLAEMPASGADGEYTAPDGTKETWRQEAIYRFENYYPTLANSAALYQNQCYHCHGPEGGGNGSTSRFLEPRPRDYRPGKFKFTALKGKSRPRHQDLFRVLAEGIYTTAMPSFRRFSDAQLHGLVDYVRLLSIRGETEILFESFYEPEAGVSFDLVKGNYKDVFDKWFKANDLVIAYDGEVPHPTPERIEHGKSLFMTPGEKGGANCASCHGTSGRGDGASAFEIDPETKKLRRVKDEWGNEIAVRDLTRGLYRFGRRPIDLYRRMYAGINGTPMPEHFGMTVTEEGKQHPLSEQDIWDIVFFVRSLGSQPLTVAAAQQPAKEGAPR